MFGVQTSAPLLHFGNDMTACEPLVTGVCRMQKSLSGVFEDFFPLHNQLVCNSASSVMIVLPRFLFLFFVCLFVCFGGVGWHLSSQACTS